MTRRSGLAICALVLVAGTLWAQPPSRGSDGGGRSRGMMFGDPTAMMDRFFAGKDYIDLNEMQEPMRSGIQRLAQMMGITGDRITRKQLEDGSKQMRERFAGGGMAAMGGAPGGAPAMSFTKGPETGGEIRGGFGDRMRGMGDSDSFAEGSFRRIDKDNDGLLNADEMSESLRPERDKWDQNRDGFIDLSEYKLYFAARMQQNQKELQELRNERGDKGDGQDGDAPDRKPVVYRSGKLPRELPAWFAQLDTNADVQIGLYEWRVSKPIAEFKQYDRNGDNFLTVEEVLLFVKLNKPAGTDSFASANGNGNGNGDRRSFSFTAGPGMPGMPAAPGMTGGERGGARGAMGERGGAPGSSPWGSRGDRGSAPGGGSPGSPWGARGERGGNDGPRMPGRDRSADPSDKREDKDAKRELRPSGMPSFGGKKKR